MSESNALVLVGKDLPDFSSRIFSCPMITVSDNQIEKNNISGDVVLGKQTKIVAPARNPRALLSLIERSKKLSEESLEYRNMLDELESFLGARPGRKIIGLEAKLMNGGRPELLEDALYLENRFSRRLAQGQTSPSSAAMFLHCLSSINSSFSTFVQPLIRSGEETSVVDIAIKLHVIDPVYEELTSVDCSLTTELVRGMLYFLTGKCHIMWE